MKKIELVDLDAVRSSQNNEPVPYANAAKRVRDWKRDHGDPSQEAFAKLAGISIGCLQSFENLTRNTRRPNLEKIAKAIGLTYEELIAGDAEPVATTDDRLKKFFHDDIEVANWYHHADGNTKIQVRRLLMEYYRHAQDKREEALRLPTEATFREHRSGVDRRSGIERRVDDHAADQRRAKNE
jgi:transcriptional regulator with XRE-family HTH domain